MSFGKAPVQRFQTIANNQIQNATQHTILVYWFNGEVPFSYYQRPARKLAFHVLGILRCKFLSIPLDFWDLWDTYICLIVEHGI